MARIIILGGGRQGRIIANDLTGDHDVTVADVATVNLPGVRSMQRDLSRPLELVGALHEYDVVVGALPGRLGFAAAQAAVKAKRHYVDLSYYIEDAAQLKRVLDSYRRDGFRVALDDLGAGWSTLTLVHRLRPDFIKLDRELICQVHRDPVKDLIASKLLEIGRGLGIRTIVEGVEHGAELQWARARGADFVQGFLIARPAPGPRRPRG